MELACRVGVKLAARVVLVGAASHCAPNSVRVVDLGAVCLEA